MIKIPSKESGSWSVAHGQDNAADIINTRNMDFERSGRANLARLPVALITTIEDSDLGLPLGFVCDGDTYYILTTGGVFSSSDGMTVTQLTTSNQPAIGFHSDIEFYNGVVVVSGSQTVKSYASGTWTDRISGLSSSYPHPLCVLEGSNRLAVGNGPAVKTYDSSWSNQDNLAIPSEYIVTWIRYRQNKAHIGTRNIVGRGARLFLWNGSGVGAQESYGVQAAWMYSGCEYASSLAIVTSAGQILRFNGGGFDEIDHFPVYELPYSWTSASSPASAVGKVASRGMIANGKSLYINIDGSMHRNGLDYPGNFLITQPGGLWEYNPKVGLHHKAGYVFSKYASRVPTGVASDVLSFSADHDALTGDPVFAKTISGLTGVTQARTYFVIKVSESSFKLANSPADAHEGRSITIAGSVSGDTFSMNVYNSIGAVYDLTAGAVGLFTNVSWYDFFGVEVMFGGRCINEAGTETGTVMAMGLGRNIGSLVTAPIFSGNVTETFQKIYEKIKHLELDSDSIRVKYRTTERFGMPTPVSSNVLGRVTWTAHNEFTVLTQYKDIKSIAEGDEITIVSGAGAGQTSKIASIDDSDADEYVITLSDDIPGVEEDYISEVIAEDWKLLENITNSKTTLDAGFNETGVYSDGSWGQFKLEYRGKSDLALTILQIISSVKKKAN